MVFGLVGYFMRRFEFNAAAFLISFVLAPGAEEALRQSMRMSGDDPAIFIERPLALLLFAIALLGLGSRVYGQVKRRRQGRPGADAG